MMEQLLETGRRILEHSHRLELLPPQAQLPHGYVSLLLDPADLLASACGALFSAEDLAEPAETISTVERHAARGLVEPLPHVHHAPTSRPHGAPAFSKSAEREAVRLQSATAPSNIAKPERANKSRLPLSLVNSTSKPFASGTPPHAPFEGTARTRFSTPEAEASLTTRTGSVMPVESLLLPSGSLSRTEPDYSSVPNITGEYVHASPDIESQIRDAAVSPEASFANREASTNPQAAKPRATAAARSQEESLVLRDVEARSQPPAEAHFQPAEARLQPLEEAQVASVNFTPSPSQLAHVLNANLAANRSVPPQSLSLEAVGAAQPPDAQSNSLQARKVSSFDKPDLSWPDSFAVPDGHGREHRSEDAGPARGADAPLVEAVLEELYERLRLEYLRAYGTSGE
jgi:hypothetical protein